MNHKPLIAFLLIQASIVIYHLHEQQSTWYFNERFLNKFKGNETEVIGQEYLLVHWECR